MTTLPDNPKLKSEESWDKIRDVLSSILGAAVRYGLLMKNPVAGIQLPKPKRRKRSKPFITPEQFTALVNLIAEPYVISHLKT
jgi:integrase